MNQSVIFLKNINDQLEVKICVVPDWDGFDKLINFITQEYHAVTLNEFDGPDARRWILKSKGHKFEVIHDDMFGNYLVAPTVESEKIVLKIGKDLEKRLKSKE